MPEHKKQGLKSRSRRQSPGWGENINLRILKVDHPVILEMLQTKTQQAFEEKYKVDFGEEVKWKMFSDRAAAILEWVAKRKDQPCEDSRSLQ
jgi:hypothetical protein